MHIAIIEQHIITLFEQEDKLLQKFNQQLEAATINLNKDKETILLEVMCADPTSNGEFIGWLIKQVKFSNIRLPEDEDRVKTILSEFVRIKKIKNAQIEKDINKYDHFADLEDKILEFSKVKSKRSEISKHKIDGSKIVTGSENYVILKILTPEAAVLYSKNTRWCTSNIKIANKYIINGLYIIFKKDKGKLIKYGQFTKDLNQVMDITDRRLTTDYELFNLLLHLAPVTKERAKNLLKNTNLSSIKYRDEDIEDAIATEPCALVSYVKHIRKYDESAIDDFKSTIMSHPEAAAEYAISIAGHRMPEIEDMVISHQEALNIYTNIFGRLKDKENKILRSKAALPYWRKFCQSIPLTNELIKLILSSNVSSDIVSLINVLKKPDRAVENAVLNKTSAIILLYIEKVLKHRWPAVEAKLHEDPRVWALYKFKYLK